MTFELKMTEQQAIDGLRSTFGNEFVAADVRGFCAANDIAYSTVTKKIQKYKLLANPTEYLFSNGEKLTKLWLLKNSCPVPLIIVEKEDILET